MEMPKLNSQSPNSHDNTEKDLIIVPPAVLDSKLRDFELHSNAKSSVKSDIALAVTLLLAFLTIDLQGNFPFVDAATLRGAFLVGFLVSTGKAGYDIVQVLRDKKGNRKELIEELLVQTITQNNANKETKQNKRNNR